MKRKVVITGIGAVSPIGNTAQEMWASAKAGVCGIGPLTGYDASNQKVQIAAEVHGLDLDAYIDRKSAKRMDRFTQFGLVAAKQAFADSGLDFSREDPTRCGVLLSSGIGGLSTIETEHSRGLAKGFDRVSPFFIPMVITNLVAGTVALELGAKGLCACIVTACASGANAIGEGMRQIRDGYADMMICGGAEASITPLGMGGFASMKALCESNDPASASIPFDARRSGFVMGEGAGVLVLEDAEHARARGAVIYGEVAGYGATCDAHHITAPDPTGDGAARCMTLALADAAVSPAQIGYLNAHGTSTPMNDRCETMAVKTAFGAYAKTLAVSSTKSMTGHLLGASGAIEAILTVLALREGFLPPTIGYRVSDPECDLNLVVNVGRAADFSYAISNSLGFGGHNVTLVFRKGEGDASCS